MTDNEPEYEPVYIAGAVHEAEAVEALFAEEDIEYQVRPTKFRHTISLNGPFAGISFGVLRGQAFYCRKLLERRGFVKGIIPAEQV